MPYIGRHKEFGNLTYAGGHAMLGVTAAAGTGKIVEEVVSNKQPTIELSAFNPARFS
jgi:D-amino-acid dehydrogenase